MRLKSNAITNNIVKAYVSGNDLLEKMGAEKDVSDFDFEKSLVLMIKYPHTFELDVETVFFCLEDEGAEAASDPFCNVKRQS